VYRSLGQEIRASSFPSDVRKISPRAARPATVDAPVSIDSLGDYYADIRIATRSNTNFPSSPSQLSSQRPPDGINRPARALHLSREPLPPGPLGHAGAHRHTQCVKNRLLQNYHGRNSICRGRSHCRPRPPRHPRFRVDCQRDRPLTRPPSLGIDSNIYNEPCRTRTFFKVRSHHARGLDVPGPAAPSTPASLSAYSPLAREEA